MIENTIVNGKPAVVTYLTKDFHSSPKENAAVVKVTFENGDQLIGMTKGKHSPLGPKANILSK